LVYSFTGVFLQTWQGSDSESESEDSKDKDQKRKVAHKAEAKEEDMGEFSDDV
jgi:hypothetical protein